MTDEDIFFDDYKEYESGGKKYSIGCINAYDEAGAKDLAERINKILPGTLASTGMDMVLPEVVTKDVNGNLGKYTDVKCSPWCAAFCFGHYSRIDNGI